MMLFDICIFYSLSNISNLLYLYLIIVLLYVVVDFGVWIFNCGFWHLDFGFWIMDFSVPSPRSPPLAPFVAGMMRWTIWTSSFWTGVMRCVSVCVCVSPSPSPRCTPIGSAEYLFFFIRYDMIWYLFIDDYRYELIWYAVLYKFDLALIPPEYFTPRFSANVSTAVIMAVLSSLGFSSESEDEEIRISNPWFVSWVPKDRFNENAWCPTKATPHSIPSILRSVYRPYTLYHKLSWLSWHQCQWRLILWVPLHSDRVPFRQSVVGWWKKEQQPGGAWLGEWRDMWHGWHGWHDVIVSLYNRIISYIKMFYLHPRIACSKYTCTLTVDPHEWQATPCTCTRVSTWSLTCSTCTFFTCSPTCAPVHPILLPPAPVSRIFSLRPFQIS